MRILIAEDDVITARCLEGLLSSWGHVVIPALDGEEALTILQGDDPPRLALLDWVMPGLDGPDVCRAVRGRETGRSLYVILLTSKNEQADIVAGLDAGADDYLVKPFDPGELRARLSAGARIIDLQINLATQVSELEHALAKVGRLNGLLPICAYCKAIRDDSDYWHRVEEYVTEHADVQFSHGICPSCLDVAMKQAEESL